MFGRGLRMPEDAPAQLSLQFVVAGSNQYRGRVGRHTTNIFDVLHSDLKEQSDVSAESTEAHTPDMLEVSA